MQRERRVEAPRRRDFLPIFAPLAREFAISVFFFSFLAFQNKATPWGASHHHSTRRPRGQTHLLFSQKTSSSLDALACRGRPLSRAGNSASRLGGGKGGFEREGAERVQSFFFLHFVFVVSSRAKLAPPRVKKRKWGAATTRLPRSPTAPGWSRRSRPRRRRRPLSPRLRPRPHRG